MHALTRLVGVTCLTMSITACGGGSGHGGSSLPDPISGAAAASLAQESVSNSPDLTAYASTQLPAAEREYVAYYLNALPDITKATIAGRNTADVHVAIIDGASDTIHYNVPSDAGTLHAVDKMSLPGDDYPSSSAEPFFNPGFSGSTGPYRRDYTPPFQANKQARTSQSAYYDGGFVTLRCKAGSFNHTKPLSDVGFLYLGGWSPTPSATGGAVDAGLQYNYELSPKSKDDYSPFIAISKVKGYVATGTHVGCNNVAFLEFLVAPILKHRDNPSCGHSDPTCQTYALVFAADVQVGSKFISYVADYISPSVTQGGWADPYTLKGSGNRPAYFSETPCGGCVFKFMTSIGQSKADYTDGSSYAATWSNKEIACAATACDGKHSVVPLPAKLTYCSEYPLWHGRYGPPYNGDCSDTPSGISGLALSVKSRAFPTQVKPTRSA